MGTSLCVAVVVAAHWATEVDGFAYGLWEARCLVFRLGTVRLSVC